MRSCNNFVILAGEPITRFGGRDGRHDEAGGAGAGEAIGAVWRRDDVLAELKSFGRAGRRAADAALGAASLTARELEIARLAAQRLTSAEIAGRLYISHRTVEGHLAHIYVKLGVNSRPDLARRLVELSL